MRKNLLFVTCHDEDCDEGLSYAISLAKTMDKGITILLVCKRKLMKRFEDIMTAVTFAEAGEHDIAKDIYSGNGKKKDDSSHQLMNSLARKCLESGVDASVEVAAIDLISAVNGLLGKKKTIDIVLLSPNVTNNGNVTARELQRLVKTASRPVVTMTRQAMLPA